MLTTAPRGTKDILSPEIEKWHYIEEKIREHCGIYDYSEIRPPLFEHTVLFQRSVGATTDIVQKEMYTFQDRADRWLTLRPEATASTVRAYLENKLYSQPQPIKLYYLGPMFRYDRPQAGRYRQFYQFGIEAIGSQDPAMDVEVILLAMRLFQGLGLHGLQLHVNSIGCPICRRAYQKELLKYLQGHLSSLCVDCENRYEHNPLRVLDCKNPKCREVAVGAPDFSNYLCDECKDHFNKVKDYLNRLGIKYQINTSLVRGLDYYTKTVFEIISLDLGAQGTVCGGGRYDGLIEECGGAPTPGVGFAMGIERLLLTLENAGIALPGRKKLDAFVASIGTASEPRAIKLLDHLRRAGLVADKDYLGRSLRAQMKYANKKDAAFVVILGDEELEKEVVVLRNMATGSQEEVPMEKVMEKIIMERGK